ncbi:cysteine hydrolase [Serratia marcescens]|uniref:cysteine hydrolase family protein n=1 Tax=Serratia marcescens TaxID=615 RepID=UPI0011F2EF79|nr:cysteine hydrolase family protein [Serratia marcescens]QKO39265.1 cysteine hydrolase [Serratia marcescens]
MTTLPAPRSALLLIDMQVGLFASPNDPPFAAETLLAKTNALIRAARLANAPVVFIRHTGPAGSPIAANSPLWQVHPSLETAAGADWFIDKTHPSCFYQTGLAERLKHAGIGRLVISGMKTQYCVDTACRRGAELGFDMVLAADAHSCSDTEALSAEAIIRHHNQTLSGPFVTLALAEEVKF